MILVFGGTTEGKQIAAILDALEESYYYSTRTKVSFSGKGIPIYGTLTKGGIEEFCTQKKIKYIINASHPFATELHATIASIHHKIALIRWEREFTKRVTHKLVYYVDSFEKAIALFEEHNYQSLLALSGVQTISKLKTYWKKYATWFRILDRDISRQIVRESEFPFSKIIYGYPQDNEEEMKLYKRLNPSVIFTKESGVNGKLAQKIQAAMQLKIPIVILKKPLLPNRYLCIHTKDELIDVLKSC